MKKEHIPITLRNEHKKRRFQGVIAVTALIATSLHLFQPEPGVLPDDRPASEFEFASFDGVADYVANLAQQALDNQGETMSAHAATSTGVVPVVDQVIGSEAGSDPGFGLATPSSCGISDSSCDDGLTPLPHPVTVAVAPPEVLLTPPADEVVAATGTAEEPPHNPYYDRSLPPQQKWALAQQLAADSCPSGSLSHTSYSVTAVMGDDHDGLLGYTDPNTHIISIDVRDKHRAVDLAETIVHEEAHARDEDGLVDRRRWLDALGYGPFPYEDTKEWFLGNYDPMAPGEAFGRLVSSALLGTDVMNESMANSGYGQDPTAEKLLAQATSQQIALAGELTGCFS